MTTYHSQEIRKRAAQTIGYPNAPTEQPIEAFQRSPVAVVQAVEKIINRVHAGRLESPVGWLIITREVAEITRAVPDVVATDSHERERAIERMRRWMHHAGLHFPSEVEVLA
jgi:hypothetical protein